MALAATGVALGVAFTLSPLTVLVLAPSVLLLQRASRTLPPGERWWFVRLFGIALLMRVAAIGLLFLVSAHDSQGSGFLFGDEAYALTRSWRFRNVLLGIPQLKYDYLTAFEGYGESSYILVMAYLQVLVGPAPYGLRVLNAALFVGAVLILFRMTRRAFGPFTAFAGSVVLLFLPTLFFWSIALLKESFYFVLTVATLAAAVETIAATTWRARVLSAAVLVAALFGLRDLRAGAVALAVSGLVTGLIVAYVSSRRLRVAIASAAFAIAIAVMLFTAPLQRRVMAAVDQAVAVHAGHVFTVGHGYKLLDEGYYLRPGIGRYDLTSAEAARYVVRAAIAYLVVPLPWQIATRGELAYLPEQLFWYALLVLAPCGAAVALTRDRVVASLLIAYVLPTAVAVAMTTGNVGTVIRHRTLIVPYLVWVSALGLASLLRRLMAQQSDLEVERLVQRSAAYRAVRALLVTLDAAAGASALARAVPRRLPLTSAGLLLVIGSLAHGQEAG